MRCLRCMEQIEGNICEKCGFDITAYAQPSEYLEIATVLKDRYQVGVALGQGGFGITYMGYDQELERKVAIKECFPLGMVSRDKNSNNVLPRETEQDRYQIGLLKFKEEAKMLAVLPRAAEMVAIHDSFSENNTYYIVMDYIDGINLKKYLEHLGKPMAVKDALAILRPIIHALKKCHKTIVQGKKVIHRDISPNNIMISSKDNSAVLIDFGTAKAIKEFTSNTTKYVTDGYSPYEVYTNDPLHEGVDVYGLSATLYKMITGIEPSSSVSRMNAYQNSKSDSLKKPSELGIVIDEKIEKVLLKGLELDPRKRYGNIEEFENDIYQKEDALSLQLHKKEKSKKWNFKKKLFAGLVSFVLLATGICGTCYILHKKSAKKVTVSFSVTTDESGYKTADLSNMSIENLDFLEYADLSNVERIDLYGNEKLDDISGLQYATDIKILNLGGDSRISDLSVLRKLKTLEQLNCYGMYKLKNLNDISTLENLNTLRLTKTSVSSLDMIGSLKKLEFLNLNECEELKDLSQLKELKNLKTLRLSGLDEGVLRTVQLDAKLDYLEVFDCESKAVTDLVKSLPELRGVGVSDNSISLDDLKNMKKLKELDLQNYTGSIEKITEFVQLEKLGITMTEDDHNIKEMQLPFSKLQNLKRLSLSLNFYVKGNEFFDINEISKLSMLEQLEIDVSTNVGIKNMGDISELINLKDLRMECSFDGNFDGITKLKNLTSLELKDGYNYSDESSTFTFPALASGKIECLELDLGECNNYSSISNLIGCKKLSLSGKFLDTNFLTSMTNLEELELETEGTSDANFDMSVLRKASNLRKLLLKNFIINNYEQLNNATALEDVNFWFPYDSNKAKLKNMKFLPENSNIKKMQVNHCTISDIAGMENAKLILSLDLASNHIPSDLSAVNSDNLPYVQSISVSDTDIKSIDTFAGITTLRDFNAANTNLNDMKNENGNYIFDSIEYMDLSNTNLGNLDWLSGCKELVSIDISGLNIKNFDIFANSPNIEMLKAQEVSALENIDGLKGCKKIESLEISPRKKSYSYWGDADEPAKLPLKDLTPIKECQHMYELSVEGCEIDNLAAILKMKELERLSISGTNIQDLSILSNMKKLELVSMDGLSVSSLSALTTLPVYELNMHNAKCPNLYEELSAMENSDPKMSIFLSDNMLKKEEIDALKTNHPDWNIYLS